MILSAIPPFKLTRQEYNEMEANGMFHPEARHELVNGDIIDISPESGLHSSAIIIVTNAFDSVVPNDFCIRTQMSLALGTDSEPEPDIVIVRGKSGDYNLSDLEKVLLVVEISESSSIDFDRKIKKKLYACSCIPEFWIINLKILCLEVYRNPLNDSYTDMKILHSSERISPLFSPESSISVADILP